MRDEVVMHRAHRNGYDHSVRACGAQILEIGYAHRAREWELDSAITERIAAVAYLVSFWAAEGALPLPTVAKIAHAHGRPVIVDAASMLLPVTNLRRFVEEGADLVCFSGGKGLRGPQAGGILCGRSDLVRAAALNMNPNDSIGRTAKVGKEEIIGTLIALEAYVARDHAADMARWKAQAETILGHVKHRSDCAAAIVPEKYKDVPLVRVRLTRPCERRPCIRHCVRVPRRFIQLASATPRTRLCSIRPCCSPGRMTRSAVGLPNVFGINRGELH